MSTSSASSASSAPDTSTISTTSDNFYYPLFYKKTDDDYSMFEKRIILSLLDIVLNNVYYKEHTHFKKELEEVNTEIEAFNKKIEAFNTDVKNYNTKVEAFNKEEQNKLDEEFKNLNNELNKLKGEYRTLNIKRAEKILEVYNSKIETQGLKLDKLSELDINTLDFTVTDGMVALIIKYGISTPVLQKISDIQLLKKITNDDVKTILNTGSYETLYDKVITSTNENEKEIKNLIDEIIKTNTILFNIPTLPNFMNNNKYYVVTYDLYQKISSPNFKKNYEEYLQKDNPTINQKEKDQQYDNLVADVKKFINDKYEIFKLLGNTEFKSSPYVHYNCGDIVNIALDPQTINDNNKQLLKDYLHNVAEFFRFYDSCHDFSNPPGGRASFTIDAGTLYKHFDFPILEKTKNLDNRMYSFMCGTLDLKQSGEVIINTNKYKTDALARYYSYDYMKIFPREKLTDIINPGDKHKYVFSVDNRLEDEPLPLFHRTNITNTDKFDEINNKYKYNLYGGTPNPSSSSGPKYIPPHLRASASGPQLLPTTTSAYIPPQPSQNRSRVSPGPASRPSTKPYASINTSNNPVTGYGYFDTCLSILKSKVDPSYDCAYEHHNALYYTLIEEIFSDIQISGKIMFYYEEFLLSDGTTKYKIQYNLINNDSDKKDILTIKNDEIIYDINIKNLNSKDSYSLKSAYPQFTLNKVSELIDTLNNTTDYNNFFTTNYINKIYSNAKPKPLLNNIIRINYTQPTIDTKKIFTRFLLSNKRMGDWGQVEIARYLAHYQIQKQLNYSHLFKFNTSYYNPNKATITEPDIYTIHKTVNARVYFSTADNPCYMFSVAFGNLNTNYANIGNGIVNYVDPTTPDSRLSQTMPNKYNFVNITNPKNPTKLTLVSEANKINRPEIPTEEEKGQIPAEKPILAPIPSLVESIVAEINKPMGENENNYTNSNEIIRGFVDDIFNDIINKIKENKENASSTGSESDSRSSLSDGSSLNIIEYLTPEEEYPYKQNIFDKVKSVFNLGVTKMTNYIKLGLSKPTSKSNKYLLKGGDNDSIEIDELIECYNDLYYTDNKQRDLLYLLFDTNDYSHSNNCISTILLSYFNILYFKLDGEITPDNYICVSTAKDELTENYYPVLNEIQKAILTGKNLFENDNIKIFLTNCYKNNNIYFIPVENLYTFLKNIIIDNANEQLTTKPTLDDNLSKSLEKIIEKIIEETKTEKQELEKQQEQAQPQVKEQDTSSQKQAKGLSTRTFRQQTLKKYIRNPNDEYYKNKYLKYKSKYLELKKN